MHSFVIILYGQRLDESPTYRSLINLVNYTKEESNLFVWDNSETKFHDENIESDSIYLDISYFHEGHNVNLSVIYNKILPLAYTLSDLVTILDQDSELPLDFFSCINSDKADVLLVPRVVSKFSGEMISPRYQKYNYILNKCNINYMPKTSPSGYYDSVDFFAVASGLTIPKSVWESGPKFRSCLSFYGVDTEYCYDYSQKNSKFYLLDIFILHDASNESDESYSVFSWRVNKYYEHWLYQLVNKLGWNEYFSKCYTFFFKYITLHKNRLKRKINLTK
ncbi:hypothetical protein R7Z42_10255 [Vibrio sp. 1863]|uniref:hypothetical protein n=1 Tax=Vibrio sp. 1863 TaxID=3074579 RepID=UPI002964BBB6|nr:hypothetical protein [Vibrio sp. 1863]MDW2075393.1 hypothetical protein [Vibrio sp. 1863]